MKMKNLFRKKEKKELTVEQKIQRRTLLSFSAFIALYGAAYASWRWLYHAPEEAEGITAGAKAPLRSALNANEKVFSSTFNEMRLAKTYPKSMAAKEVRQNGDIGLAEDFDAATWKLQVTKKSGAVINITLNDLKQLPKTEIVYDFKCIEGWDQISHWAGVRFSDFVKHYGLHQEINMQYVGLSTPDDEYYVGIDMPGAMHTQTLLCYEMNDHPLLPEHGAPLRLIIPVKYGIKNLKRIGTMFFSNERPPDYWAEQGYDYYSGL